MDLSNFNLPESTAIMEVINPDTGEVITDGDGNPATIEVLSSDSEEFRQRERRISQNRTRARRRITAEDMQIDKAVAATKAISGIMLDGAPVTPENCRKAYQQHPWLFNDVLVFSHDRGNYQGNS